MSRFFVAALLICGSADALVAGVLRGNLPGEDAALVDRLHEVLAASGYEVVELDAAGLCDAARLSGVDLLVLPNAAALPADSVAPVEAYLRGGGDIIALNAPLWRRLLIRVDGQWVSREECERQRAGQLPDHLLLDFSPESIAGWKRSTSEANTEAVYETVGEGPAAGQRSLHVKLNAYRGWDTFAPDSADVPFPEGHTLTVFSAKGGPDTHSLSVEWREKDGCRWIAAVPLTTEWRQYVLAPGDFKFWESDPARRNDVFHPENTGTLAIGLALTHTGAGGLSQEYWVSGFGTSRMTEEQGRLLAAPVIPKLELLSPGYKFFDSTGVAALALCGAGVPPAALPPAERIRSVQPRPTAAGFDKGRAWRWMPLIEARTRDGAWRGAPAAMMAHVDGLFKGGQWASFGIDDPEWYKSAGALEMVRGVADKMRRGLHIVDGGANFYTHFDGQDVTLGLRIANCDTRDQKLTARITVTAESAPQAALFAKEWPVELAAGSETRVAESWRPDMWLSNGFQVSAQLLQDGEVVDEAAHAINVWQPKAEKKFITVKDGDFVLDGKRWRAHGVNYMPSTGIGTEDGDYFEQWLGARAYDPEAIDRDLDHIVDMGLNSVSIFLYHQSMLSQNLLDLLRRLEARGLKANLSLRPGTPMDFEWDKVREMIGYYRLAENDTVFAYDLAWEPLWMLQKDRQRWDGEWEAWAIERYGSVANAERDWGWPIPRNAEGKVTNPPVEHTDEDGEWRRMVAAYRRFLDTLLYKNYSRARDLVRSVDPNHLVSFRMTEAGNPTMSWRGVMPYDFPYLAAAVDIFEPEAYGRIGDWEKVKPGWYEYEYARWAAPELPVMWAEAGVSAWDLGTMRSSEDKLQFQGEYFGHIYRMLISSGADGMFWWWYPGGFRTGENSDYGIINPDGSDRAATRMIREQARAFLDGPEAGAIDHWIEIDRDKRAEGLPGVYKETQADFWEAIEKGKVPGLRTAGTGTTSANCPMVAVGGTPRGGTPCDGTPCDGTNPPKYLDAYFDWVAAGELRIADCGSRIEREKGQPANVRVTNLGEAEWLAEGDGAVCLVVQSGNETRRIPLKKSVAARDSVVFEDVPLADGPAELRLEAVGRTLFGQKLVIEIVSKN